MSVRAKFTCTRVASDVAGAEITLSVVYDTDLAKEDGRFTKATPWGELKMRVDNPEAAIQFVPGQHYYVDFSLAPTKSTQLPQ